MVNTFQKSLFVFIIVTGVIIIWVFALTTLIKSTNSDFIFVSTLVMLLIDAVLVDLVILGQMGAVYRKSHELLDVMKCAHNPNLTGREQKWEHKFYRSCPPLKIMINSVNFVDGLTPLNCLHLSMTLSANILMLE